MSGPRQYRSPLREAQAALTRDRILMAAKDYLEREDIESLTLRRVAELSAVSPPTVYANFPTMDDLIAAFFHWLKPRLGLLEPVPGLDQLHTMPRRLFPHYEEHGALLRNLMNKPAWDRQRGNDRQARHRPWLDAIGAELPHLTPEQLRRGGLAIAAAWTPTHWRWLMDTCCFTPEEAQTVASWTIQSLVAGLKSNPSGLETVVAPPAPGQDELP